MHPSDFIAQYQAALAAQSWQQVAPLIHTNATVTFSNGAVHKGIADIQQAYERNFALIKNEQYHVSDIHWLTEGPATAVYTFAFEWKGFINGQPAGGKGRGTAVLTLHNGQWQLLAEHLGTAAQ